MSAKVKTVSKLVSSVSKCPELLWSWGGLQAGPAMAMGSREGQGCWLRLTSPAVTINDGVSPAEFAVGKRLGWGSQGVGQSWPSATLLRETAPPPPAWTQMSAQLWDT